MNSSFMEVTSALEDEIGRLRREAPPRLNDLSPAACAEWWRASLLHWCDSHRGTAGKEEWIAGLATALCDFTTREMLCFVSTAVTACDAHVNRTSRAPELRAQPARTRREVACLTTNFPREK